MGTGTGGPKGGSGMAQQQSIPAPGTAGYGNGGYGGAGTGKGSGPKGGGGTPQQQNPQMPQSLPQANSDLQKQQLQALQARAMDGSRPPADMQNMYRRDMMARMGGMGGGIAGLQHSPIGAPPDGGASMFLNDQGGQSDPGTITPAAAATGASPGGPLSGRTEGFGGYGRFRGWGGMGRGGFGGMMGNGMMGMMGGGATPAGFANGGIVGLANGGKVYQPDPWTMGDFLNPMSEPPRTYVESGPPGGAERGLKMPVPVQNFVRPEGDPLDDLSQYQTGGGFPEWLDQYIPSVAGYATTGDFFATDPEIQRGIAKKERAGKVRHANGGIVGLAAGGPISWSPTAAAPRATTAALPAITTPAAYVAQPQQAIWQPPAAAAAPVAAAANIARNRLNAMRAANAQFGRNGAAGGFMGGGAGGSGAMGGGGWGGFGGGSAGSNWGGRGAY